MRDTLSAQLAALPTRPGVYLMKGAEGRVVYVGKAVNLRNRVRSYFNRGHDGRAFVQVLEHWVHELETIVVRSEAEALLLENELIKKHRPRFNVQLRDDKNYLCLKLDRSHPYPRLETVRGFGDDGAKYFGPYASAGSLRDTLRVVNKHFQLRTCSDHVLEHRKRPCLLYQLGRCPAPCVYDVTVGDYARNVDAVELFLAGRGEALVAALKQRMHEAAAATRFEEAARLRDQMVAMQRSLERQSVASPSMVDQDVIGFFREADRVTVYAMFVREGRLSDTMTHHFAGQEFPDEEILESFLTQFYLERRSAPDEVLVPFALATGDALAALLSSKRGRTVSIRWPQRGEKVAALKLAMANAAKAASERQTDASDMEVALLGLQERLGLSRRPERIECFDVSHLQGQSLVASQVVALAGEPAPDQYRHYTLKTVGGNDDFKSMYEVISRRVRRGLAEGALPDLLLIDGGKGQLAAARAAAKDAGAPAIDIVALAKSKERGGRQVDAAAVKTPERVFVEGRKDPVVLARHSRELLILTRMRDEAHRFAIGHQRKRTRKGVASELEHIAGVGPTRRRALLRKFGSVRQLRSAPLDAVAEVVGRPLAQRVLDALAPPEEVGDDPVRAASLDDAQPPGPF